MSGSQESISKNQTHCRSITGTRLRASALDEFSRLTRHMSFSSAQQPRDVNSERKDMQSLPTRLVLFARHRFQPISPVRQQAITILEHRFVACPYAQLMSLPYHEVSTCPHALIDFVDVVWPRFSRPISNQSSISAVVLY